MRFYHSSTFESIEHWKGRLMKKKIQKGKLYYSIQIISVLPLFFYGVLILLVGTFTFTKHMQKEVQTELSHIASMTQEVLDTKYPGDYRLVGESSYQLHKGNADITGDYALLDQIKEKTGMDVTLYYKDTRILTTVTDWSGNRIIGTSAPEIVINDVLKGGEQKFYDKTTINTQTYYSYYCPLKNSDGSVVGMLFVGEPSAEINESTKRAVYPLCAVGIIAMVITCFISIYFVKGFANALEKLKNFFSGVAGGNLHEKIDSSLLNRGDEFSDMAKSAKTMQHSMRKLIEHDPLTNLYNRRSGQYYFDEVKKKAQTAQTPFSVVLGDIDFFKKVNDTYGHEAGDIVLKNVAMKLRTLTKERGYAIRWGGEEFLLILENSDLEQSAAIMEGFLEEIRAMVNDFGDTQIKITMTFGIACDPARTLNALAADADEKLYYGKEHGRNQIVKEIP